MDEGMEWGVDKRKTIGSLRLFHFSFLFSFSFSSAVYYNKIRLSNFHRVEENRSNNSLYDELVEENKGGMETL